MFIPSDLGCRAAHIETLTIAHARGVAWRGVAWRGVAWRGVALSCVCIYIYMCVCVYVCMCVCVCVSLFVCCEVEGLLHPVGR